MADADDAADAPLFRHAVDGPIYVLHVYTFMPITTAGCMDLICVSAADVWTKWTPGQIQANNCTMSFFFLSTFTLFFSLSLRLS